jgi:succinoglycan biosynthesis protein ExoA
MPVRNEEQYLRSSVEAVLAQEYPGAMDVWISVAPSTDATSSVVDDLVNQHANVFRVENPAGITPAGLNVAIAVSSGEVIVRVDGHVRLCDGYIQQAVKTLLETGAANVGGRQMAVGSTRFEKAVAAVMMSPVGSGGATYRSGGEPGPTDTVFLGVFQRRAGEQVGWFDESLIRNQDYELNIRLRNADGVVWFDPKLVVEYEPRSSLRGLSRQYFDYGRFKAQVLHMHSSSIRMRQLIPPVAVIATLLSVIIGWWLPITLLVPVLYLTAIALGVKGAFLMRLLALAIAPTMHFSWSLGLFIGMTRKKLN